jgi:chemotaxis response regulator CheB
MKVAIASSQPETVETLRRIIVETKRHEICWIAENGKDAVEKCGRHPPDLLLMELQIPPMGGIETTRRIMKTSPCAILIITPSVSDNASKVFEALGAGALDAVETPTSSGCAGKEEETPFLSKLNMVGKLIGSLSGKKTPTAVAQVGPLSPADACLVAIGASAGGPAAVASILSELPSVIPAAIVVVQHLDKRFTEGLVSWLDRQTELTIKIAKQGDSPEQGAVLVAGTDDHLTLTPSGTLAYTPEPRKDPYRPSIDVFFESVASYWRGKAIGVLLTGMGRDGARGLRSMRLASHHTIAQDKNSCAVFGMSKAAIEIGAAAEVLPLEKIAAALLSRLQVAVPPNASKIA